MSTLEQSSWVFGMHLLHVVSVTILPSEMAESSLFSTWWSRKIPLSSHLSQHWVSYPFLISVCGSIGYKVSSPLKAVLYPVTSEGESVA